VHKQGADKATDESARRLPAARGVSAPAASAAAALAAGELSPQAVLALQRAVGNTAVSRMIEESHHQYGAGCGHDQPAAESSAPVQRSTVHDVLRSGGQPLDGATRTDMETRLGAEFSDVRVHTDSAAKASAAEVGARAYTSGNHVVIGDGGADKHTLAHELTHVIQQRQGSVAGTDNGAGLRVSDPGDRFEREAEATATRVMSGATAAPASAPAATGPEHSVQTVQRAGPERHGRSNAARNAANPMGASQATSTPASRLSAPLVDEGLEGECGYFERRRAWRVTPPQRGFIIQKITRRFNVERFNGTDWEALPASEIDGYINKPGSKTYGHIAEYWELWSVNEQGEVDNEGEDTFGLCSITPGNKKKDTTKGTYDISGVAHFYPLGDKNLRPDDLGLVEHAVITAGGLPSAHSDPSAAIQQAGLTASLACTYNVHVKWDSSAKDRYSEVS